MMEAVLDYLMIESATDFWLFTGGFLVIAGAFMLTVWKAIFRR